MLLTAVRTYLDLQEDEVLLGIVGVEKEGHPGLGCALTTKRIYWPGRPARAPGSRPPHCRSLVYASLPETIGTGVFGRSAIDLGIGEADRDGGRASRSARR